MRWALSVDGPHGESHAEVDSHLTHEVPQMNRSYDYLRWALSVDGPHGGSHAKVDSHLTQDFPKINRKQTCYGCGRAFGFLHGTSGPCSENTLASHLPWYGCAHHNTHTKHYTCTLPTIAGSKLCAVTICIAQISPRPRITLGIVTNDNARREAGMRNDGTSQDNVPGKTYREDAIPHTTWCSQNYQRAQRYWDNAVYGGGTIVRACVAVNVQHSATVEEIYRSQPFRVTVRFKIQKRDVE